MTQRILVVEDEPAISDVVCTALRYQGYSVTQTDNGTDGLRLATDTIFDLIVLDVLLPGLDGYEVCTQLRDAGRFSPVLFLSALGETSDRVKGLVVGGDDYLAKPFSVDELTLRVAAILRRGAASTASADQLRVGDLVVDLQALEAHRAGVRLDLSPTEFRLLHYMVINAGTVLSKAQILVNVWDYDYDGSENVVEVYIGYLRRKIDDGRSAMIHTRRGMGYILREPEA